MCGRCAYILPMTASDPSAGGSLKGTVDGDAVEGVQNLCRSVTAVAVVATKVERKLNSMRQKSTKKPNTVFGIDQSVEVRKLWPSSDRKR